MTVQPECHLQKGSCAWKGCQSMKNKWVDLFESNIRVRACKKHRRISYLE